MSRRIGIMQGRLTLPVGERIQAFPAANWRGEFASAREAGLQSIEWIFDVDDEGVNPISTPEGIAEMLGLSAKYSVAVTSLCADYFMSEPLLRGNSGEREYRRVKLDWLIHQCFKASINRVVLPFVDHSQISGEGDFRGLISLLDDLLPQAESSGVEIHLETSLPPQRFALLLAAVDHPFLKVNYDSGNSASLGYLPEEEFTAYGRRIGSVHIKDRLRNGGTVPLGQGDADFASLFHCLEKSGYQGDFILQVARSAPGDEVAWARQNIAALKRWLCPAS